MKTSRIVLTLVLLTALVAGGIYYFRDTTGPQLGLVPEARPVSAKSPPQLKLDDPGSGLRSVAVTLVQGPKSFDLLQRDYEVGAMSRQEVLPLEGLPLLEGPFEIRVTAVDRSIFPFGGGNTSEQTFSLTYDSKAPVISVLSSSHNLNRGGSGLIVYSLSEEVESTGIRVGERFFPGYRQPSGNYACLFAFPFDVSAGDFLPKLIAVDRAGNERRGGFYFHANNRTFRKRRINISDNFLEAKMPPFETQFPEAGSPREVFLKVNRELRQQNRAALADFGRDTAPQALWEGAFLRQPQAATLAIFGDQRSYIYNGNKIDGQTHLGIDLASVAQAPVPAVNAGRVVFADYLGIYGNCVIVDHGLGLQSLYGHLSRIEVETGQEVERGQIVGNTGATGMAGGDHLHLGIIVSGTPVNPVEWWDAQWIRNNLTDKLQLAAQIE